MMFISHDLAVIRHISDRVAVMYLGEIVEHATVDALFETPAYPYTQALLRAIPRPTPRRAEGRRALQGDMPDPTAPPGGCPFHTRCPAVMRAAAPRSQR